MSGLFIIKCVFITIQSTYHKRTRRYLYKKRSNELMTLKSSNPNKEESKGSRSRISIKNSYTLPSFNKEMYCSRSDLHAKGSLKHICSQSFLKEKYLSKTLVFILCPKKYWYKTVQHTLYKQYNHTTSIEHLYSTR